MTVLVFGECGSGKSTLLSLIAKLYAQRYLGARREQAMVFDHSESIKSVTSEVRVAKDGDLILIDTPGTNDPKKKMLDSQIYIEMANAVRILLSSMEEGISTITQCVMTPASKRLHHSVLVSMANMLLMLSSFYEGTDLERHPRICVVFTNASK